MTIQAKKLANYISIFELLCLFIGGSIIACYMLNKSLLILILVTVGWILVIIVENIALSFNSYYFLLIIGLFRMIILSGVCVIPIILTSYYSQNSGM